jgi:DNA mismatch repair ATPase MutS
MQVFDREIQFYVSYLEYLPKLKQAGLQFCYPEVSPSQKNIYTNDGFDIALAYTLIEQNMPVVCNDFYLHGNERIIVVSGPNQGGKTTFARTFGQLHFLASIGCPVPGKKAKLFLFDRIFTHFAKGENTKDMRSKLEDDLLRIHTIFNTATPATIIIMNEIFSSTTLRDSMLLSEKIMGKISTLDSLCVWVTFIDEITALSKKAISMVSTVSAGNPVLRTFKIVRKPGEGLAYALSIAEKYRLTYQSLKERIKT